MANRWNACCSSPAAMGYWITVSLVAWGALSLIGFLWRPLHASSAVPCLFAMAVGCFANWYRNRSLHCAITGPLFLIAGTVFLCSDVHLIKIKDDWVWPFVLVGTLIAFLLEWVYASRRISSL